MLVKKQKNRIVGKRVNTAHVDAVIRNYKQERWLANTKRLGKEDSLSVWYSVEELENFLATVKSEGGNGIRLYFGVYDKDYTEQPKYAGRQTLVLVATRSKETETGTVEKDIYINNEQGTTILAYNQGYLCPPFCKKKDGIDGDDIGITIVDKGDEGLHIL